MQDDGGEPATVNCEFPHLDSPPRQLPRDTLADIQHNQRHTLPSTPSRQVVPGGLQYGSPWRTGPATPLSAQLWRSHLNPEMTPDHPIGSCYSGQGPPRITITVPERLSRDRTVRFDHGGTTYSVTIPPDYSPGSRVEVELTAPLSRPPPPPPIGLDSAMSPRQFGSPVMSTRRTFDSPVMVVENDTNSVLRIRRDVNRFREDLRANNMVKQHLRHQLELLQEESQLIDACLTSKAEIKRLSDELHESEQHVAAKKEKALAPSPTKSTPSSRPEATGQGAQSSSPVPSGSGPAASDSLGASGSAQVTRDPLAVSLSPQDSSIAHVGESDVMSPGQDEADQVPPGVAPVAPAQGPVPQSAPTVVSLSSPPAMD